MDFLVLLKKKSYFVFIECIKYSSKYFMGNFCIPFEVFFLVNRWFSEMRIDIFPTTKFIHTVSSQTTIAHRREELVLFSNDSNDNKFNDSVMQWNF